MAANPLTMAENGEAHFSRLEASFAQTKVAPRRNSVDMNALSRHTEPTDLNVNELDFDFSLDDGHYPLNSLQSLQDVFSAVQHEMHLSNQKNFSDTTQIKCFDTNGDSATWHDLSSYSLSDLLQSATHSQQRSTDSSGIYTTSAQQPRPKPARLLAFFVHLVPTPNTSFGSRIAMTRSSTTDLFTSLQVNPLYLMNLLGRPDYWAPQTRWESDSNGNFSACDFFCQHPRWNLQFQGAPLSVYMRYNAASNLTTYIISHKQGDTSIRALHDILNLTAKTAPSNARAGIFLDDPFDLAVILSTLSFETSKYHVKRFQRFMWTQVNKVDDHLSGLETSDRSRLSDLTKQLQIISQNADSHLGNASVAIITATAIRIAHSRLHTTISSREFAYERASDSIRYVIESLEKQKIWFLNYKNRKDSTMSLVYNLVTQQDAASNIQLASSMKQDSSSMNAIAALTMVFFPGTFTATVMSAGIFSAVANDRSIRVSGIWWLWVTITLPLTILVVICWWWYKRFKARK